MPRSVLSTSLLSSGSTAPVTWCDLNASAYCLKPSSLSQRATSATPHPAGPAAEGGGGGGEPAWSSPSTTPILLRKRLRPRAATGCDTSLAAGLCVVAVLWWVAYAGGSDTAEPRPREPPLAPRADTTSLPPLPPRAPREVFMRACARRSRVERASPRDGALASRTCTDVAIC
eukprot:scaffold45027_cov62-Phaeocystis_antarctica.AAC.8